MGYDDFQRALQPPRLFEPGSAPLGAKKVVVDIKEIRNVGRVGLWIGIGVEDLGRREKEENRMRFAKIFFFEYSI